MLNREPPDDTPVWFLDERGQVRRGIALRATGGYVAIVAGQSLLKVARKDCFIDEFDAVHARVQQLNDEIAMRETARAALLKRLAELGQPCRCQTAVPDPAF